MNRDSWFASPLLPISLTESVAKSQIITKTIFIISLVSFFTDISSEMLYPIMPLYLHSIGFSMTWIGILEGVAEAIAGYSKGSFGIMSDKLGKRLPFVQMGYLLSAISKPLLGFFSNPSFILASRSLDRLGKGIRSGARDAMLSDDSNQENKGKVFGFHRMMDTLGACLGPFLALLYLEQNPNDYKSLFFIAFVPGLISFFFTFFLSEKKDISFNHKKEYTSQWNFIKDSPAEYKKVIIGLIAFTFFNSSDFFLLFKIKESGFDDSELIYIYIFYNLVYAITSYPIGIISDKIGMKKIYSIGLFLFSLVYFGMGLFHTFSIYLILFLLYGLFSACTEGVSKAWITNIIPGNASSAVGVYSGLNSVITFISSSLAGIIWSFHGSDFFFIYTGMGSIFVILYIQFITIENTISSTQQNHHS